MRLTDCWCIQPLATHRRRIQKAQIIFVFTKMICAFYKYAYLVPFIGQWIDFHWFKLCPVWRNTLMNEGFNVYRQKYLARCSLPWVLFKIHPALLSFLLSLCFTAQSLCPVFPFKLLLQSGQTPSCCHANDCMPSLWPLVVGVVTCLLLKLCCFRSPEVFDVWKM